MRSLKGLDTIKEILVRTSKNVQNPFDSRDEFGHWEIDTVIGLKSKEDKVLLTITERQTRNSIILLIPSKTADAVTEALNLIKEFLVQNSAKYSKQSW